MTTHNGIFDSLKQRMRVLDNEFTSDLFATRHVPNELFQYTDVTGLKGILESKKWRATHYRYLNDGKEITYADEIICNILMEYLEVRRDDPLATVYESILGEPHEKPTILRAFDYDIYVTSFSENGDLLDQWRAYAANGNGYSIGIIPQELKYKIHSPTILSSHDEELAFVRVIYDPDEQRNLIDHLIDEVRTIVISEVGTISQHERHEFLTEVAHHLSRFLWHLTLFFKHPAFRNEQEWRIVKTRRGRNLSIAGGGNSVPLRGVLYRPSENRLIPYIELDFSAKANDHVMPISRIILGPKQRHTNARESLEMFLTSLDYQDSDMRVQSSQIAFQ